MSFREIRNLIEHTRALGFSRTISFENFSTPNFHLVAEIIIWALKTIDTNYEVNGIIDSEQERIHFIRCASIFFYQKLGIQVNPAKLYGADKLAARELLKVTSALYGAVRTAVFESTDDGRVSSLDESFSVNIQCKDIREVRQLASSIVMDAASLHDNLNSEIDGKLKTLFENTVNKMDVLQDEAFQMTREAVLNSSLDIDQLEAMLVSALHALSAKMAEIKDATEVMEKQEIQIDEKIKRKEESLIRKNRRLEAMIKIKPSWQTEFEQEEADLQYLWADYIVKHKNLLYLENELDDLEEQELLSLNAAKRKGEVTATDALLKTRDAKHFQKTSSRVYGSMTGDNLLSSEESESIDSVFIDSASDDDSLTLLSKDETSRGAKVYESASMSPQKGSLQDYSLYRRVSTSAKCNNNGKKQSSSVRPKSAHLAWTGSVKGSERVSPLSASEDNSDGF